MIKETRYLTEGLQKLYSSSNDREINYYLHLAREHSKIDILVEEVEKNTFYSVYLMVGKFEGSRVVFANLDIVVSRETVIDFLIGVYAGARSIEQLKSYETRTENTEDIFFKIRSALGFSQNYFDSDDVSIIGAVNSLPSTDTLLTIAVNGNKFPFNRVELSQDGLLYIPIGNGKYIICRENETE